MEQAKYGVFERGGYPAQYHTTDICDGCAQGHDGMNYILASREAIADMIEVHRLGLPVGRHAAVRLVRQIHPRAAQGGRAAGPAHHLHPGRQHAPGP